MKRFFLTLFLVFTMAAAAYGKEASLTMEWTFESESEPYVQEFRLYYAETIGEMVQIGSLTDVTAREWTTANMDIPPGKPLQYFLSAVYEDGEMFSEPFVFALRGKPLIIKINRS